MHGLVVLPIAGHPTLSAPVTLCTWPSVPAPLGPACLPAAESVEKTTQTFYHLEWAI